MYDMHSILTSTRVGRRNMKMIALCGEKRGPAILWIHGGGYMLGMKSMVYGSCGKMLVERYGGIVVSPSYRLAPRHRYPAALEDCFAALSWMWEHAEELGGDREKIVVGGESAGGGLAAAVCLKARDEGEIPIAMQLPLYPMLDCRDTASSADNHGRVWNTARNHRGWAAYLGDLYGTDDVPAYASAARETDYSGLPPCYTFVGDGEPFYAETLAYAEALQRAGVEAHLDVYHQDIHAFDMLTPWQRDSREAKERLCRAFARQLKL